MSDNFIDDVLSFGSAFDWIGPTITLIQDWVNRPTRNFASTNTDYAYYIENALAKKGITVWGMAMYGDEIVWSTREAQAKFAIWILNEEGIGHKSKCAFSFFGEWK